MYTLINNLWKEFDLFIYSYKKDKKIKYKNWLNKIDQKIINKKTLIKIITNQNYIYKIENYESTNFIDFLHLYFKYYLLTYWCNFLLIKSKLENLQDIMDIKINNYDQNNATNWYNNLFTIDQMINQKENNLLILRKSLKQNLYDLEKIIIESKYTNYKNVCNKYVKRINKKLEIVNTFMNLNNLLKTTNIIESVKQLKDQKNNEYLNIINNKKVFEFYDLYKIIRPEIKKLELNTDINSMYCYEFSNFKKLIKKQIKNENNQVTIIRLNKLLNNRNLNWEELLEKEKNLHLLKYEVKNELYVERLNSIINRIKQFSELIKSINTRFGPKNSYQIDINISKKLTQRIENSFLVIDKYQTILNKLEKSYSYSILNELDINFYRQIIINLNLIIESIKKNDIIKISYNQFKNYDILKNNLEIEKLKKEFISKDEFYDNINKINKRIDKLGNKFDFKPRNKMDLISTSIISLYLWKQQNSKKNIN
tara:strand:- start:697 stop:2142 length:1446 start_codon:yes stop_codon:yes gene_type:complete